MVEIRCFVNNNVINEQSKKKVFNFAFLTITTI